MGIRNYLIEGVSGAGKTAAAVELERRGYHVVHGDRELKCLNDPKTGALLVEPTHLSELGKAVWRHEHHFWDVEKVRSIIADHGSATTFLCGGSRNFSQFVDLLNGVFVLEVEDIRTIHRRLDQRVALDPTDWGGRPAEKALTARLHATKVDMPRGVAIDADQTIAHVVDDILALADPAPRN